MEFVKVNEFNRDIKSEMSKIFVDGFYEWLKYFSKDKDKLIEAFKHMFNEDAFYVAIEDDKVLSMAACSPKNSRSVKLNKKELIKNLGFIKGRIAYMILHKEFEIKEYPIEISNHMGKIEFVATKVEARGKEVAYRLLQHIIHNTSFDEYVLEVASSNEKAIKLYNRIGFYEVKKVPQKHAKQSGFDNLIYMQLRKKT